MFEPRITLTDIIHSPVVSAVPSDSARSALERMSVHAVSCMAVLDGEEPVGIITGRDLLRKVGGRQWGGLSVSDIMNASLVTAPADMDYHEAYQLLVEHNIHHLVVVDQERKLAGIASEPDFLRHLGPEGFSENKLVREVMIDSPLTFAEQEPLEDVIRLMDSHEVNCVVVERFGRPCGIVTEHDVVRFIHMDSDCYDQPVGQFMSRPPHTVRVGDSVHAASKLMTQHCIGRLVVVDAVGKTAGLVTQHDIVKSLGLKYTDFLKEVIRHQARRLNESRLHISDTLILDNVLRSVTDYGVVATDLDFRVVYHNPAASEILDYQFDSSDNFTVKEVCARYGIEGELWDKATDIITGEGAFCHSAKLETPGSLRYVDIRLFGIWDGSGTLNGYLLMAHDVSELKHYEAEQAAYRQYLEDLGRVDQVIRQTTNLEKMIKEVVEVISSIFRSDRAWLLHPCNPDAASWSVSFQCERRQYKGSVIDLRDIAMTPEQACVFREALLNEGAVVYDRASGRTMTEITRQFSVKSQMLMAIKPRLGAVWALAVHQCSHARSWTSAEQKLFTDIGHRVADALGNVLFMRSLHRAEREWEAAFNAVSDHIAVCDMNGLVLRANSSMRDHFTPMFGDPVGRNCRLLYYGADKENGAPPCIKAFAGKGPVVEEARFPTMDGWQLAAAYPCFDVKGKQAGVVLVIRDITQQKSSEVALRESEERYRNLVDTMTEGLAIQDEQGVVRYVNDSLCDMLGYSRDEFIGKPITFFIGEENMGRWAEIMRGNRDNRGEAYEAQMANRYGEPACLRISPQILCDSQGEYKGSFAVFTDLTERKHWEETLRKQWMAIEQSPNAIIITNENGVMEYVNSYLTKMSGFSKEDLMGQSLNMLESSGDADVSYEDMWRSVRTGETWRGELINTTQAGQLYWVAAEVSAIKDESGQVNHYLAIQTDITDKRQAEEEARVHRDQLAHVARMSTLGEMASGLAHELNQPLTAINSYSETGLELIKSGREATEQLNYLLEQSHSQAMRAGEIIRRLRNLVRKEPGCRDPADINELLKEVLAIAQPEFRDRNVNLNLMLDEGLPLVPVDAIQVEQVMLNLLFNASEAMGTGGTLSLVTTLNSAGEVQFSVQDTGPGFDEETRSKVFDAFFTTKGKGLGMGLSISRSIIKSHGGLLWAENAEPNGAVFRFTLPVAGVKEGGD